MTDHSVLDGAAIEVEASSGNVFADLGLPHPDERLAKAELVRVVRSAIKGNGWTQRKAATVLGIAESDMSDLMRGKLSRFSRERIDRFLNALDFEVEIRVRHRQAPGGHAGISVVFEPAIAPL